MKKTIFSFLRKYFLLILFLLSINKLFSNNKTIDSLLNVLRTVKEDTNQVNTLWSLSKQYLDNDPDKAEGYLKDGIELSKKINYDAGLAKAYFLMGIIQSNKGSLEKALTIIYDALKIANTINDNVLKYKLYNQLGVINKKSGNYKSALENYFQALKMAEFSTDTSMIATINGNLGNVYSALGNNDYAVKYLQRGIDLSEKIKSPSVSPYINIGIVYQQTKNLEKALEYFNKAVEISRIQNNNHSLAIAYINIGVVYANKKELKKCEEYYKKSLAILEEIGDKHTMSLIQCNLAGLSIDNGNYSDAKHWLLESLDIANEIQSKELFKRVYGQMMQLYERMKIYDLAYENALVYMDYTDSVNDENNKKGMAELQVQYETEKKDKEITLLKKENELKEAKAKQEKILAFSVVLGVLLLSVLLFAFYNRKQIKRRLTLEKELIEYEQKALHLQMNPHFIFNCLGSISSFIAQNNSDRAITYLSKFSKLMRLTLEYSKMPLIPVEKEIESLKNYLELEQLRFKEKFEFDIKVGPGMEDDISLPPMLIQPFVENAILHGLALKPEKGKIEIAFSIENNMLVCKIEDNGIGREKSKEIKEQSLPGHKSMAMEITRKRLDMLEITTSKHAHLIIDDVMNENQEVGGTCVTIDIPIQYIAAA